MFTLYYDFVFPQVLGFVNPAIYALAVSTPSAFHDITSGDNSCTETTCTGCTGYGAAAGWDPATGASFMSMCICAVWGMMCIVDGRSNVSDRAAVLVPTHHWVVAECVGRLLS